MKVSVFMIIQKQWRFEDEAEKIRERLLQLE